MADIGKDKYMQVQLSIVYNNEVYGNIHTVL